MMTTKPLSIRLNTAHYSDKCCRNYNNHSGSSYEQNQQHEHQHHHHHHDCTLAVIRALTRPCINPPRCVQQQELQEFLISPWTVRVPVNASTDYATTNHWQSQERNTPLFHQMFDWQTENNNTTTNTKTTTTTATTTASLHPYFSLGDPSQLLFQPWEDVGLCLKHLLLHQVQTNHDRSKYIQLLIHDVSLFWATTSPLFQDERDVPILWKPEENKHNRHYYLLRCHYDKENQQLQFGYHVPLFLEEQEQEQEQDKSVLSEFHILHQVSILDNPEWKLTTCILLKNMARILNCVKDYAMPLCWTQHNNRSSTQLLIKEKCIEKRYTSPIICNTIPGSPTVHNMISIYQTIHEMGVPHTDQLVSVETTTTTTNTQENDNNNNHHDSSSIIIIICRFAPVGRAYLPEHVHELFDALICIAETLVALHSLGIMHRDIRWSNVFHSLAADNHNDHPDDKDDDDNNECFTREWVLFDFEFAVYAPQPAFAPHTLSPENHAPEMIATANNTNTTTNTTNNNDHQKSHDVQVDIWGLGYMMQTAFVDIPESHAADMRRLQNDCLQKDPWNRPTAAQCLERLQLLQARPCSSEKDVLQYTTL